MRSVRVFLFLFVSMYLCPVGGGDGPELVCPKIVSRRRTSLIYQQEASAFADVYLIS